MAKTIIISSVITSINNKMRPTLPRFAGCCATSQAITGVNPLSDKHRRHSRLIFEIELLSNSCHFMANHGRCQGLHDLP
jgi:hypothetical protein